MPPTLDHIGICVKDLDRAIEIYRDGLGLSLERIEEIPERGIKVAFFAANNTHIEVIIPLSDRSEVSSFLEKKGEGIHHMAFSVDSIDKSLEQADDVSLKVISDSIKTGAKGGMVAFFHPKTSQGVLIEIVEKKTSE